MRYLLIILLFFAVNLFAQAPQPNCAVTGTKSLTQDRNLQSLSNTCLSNQSPTNTKYFRTYGPGPDAGSYTTTYFSCDSQCTCPQGSTWYTGVDTSGNPTSGCSDDGNGEEVPPDDLCPSGLPKVDGQCPVCLGEDPYNPDGTCRDDSSGSSAASAGAASSPPTSQSNTSQTNTSQSNTSTGSGSGSGGGSGGDSGSGTGGAGSSAANTSTQSGINNSWNPYSGYGNWIPIDADSPCPNKYVDISGQWWCAGGSTAGGSGTGVGSAASAGSARSASGQCDPTATDYLSCISGAQGSSARISSGSASSVSSGTASSSGSSSGAFSSLGEKGEFDPETSEKKHEEIIEELNTKIADIKAEIMSEVGGSVSGTGSIQDFCKNIRSADVCFGLEKWKAFLEPISTAIFLVACVLSFYIVLRS